MSGRPSLQDPEYLIAWWRTLHPDGDRLIGNLAVLVRGWLDDDAPSGLYERQLHGVNDRDEEVFHADALFLIERDEEGKTVHLLLLKTQGDPDPPPAWASDEGV